MLLHKDALWPVLIVDKLCPFGPSICLMGTLQPIWDRKNNRGLLQVLKVNTKGLVPEEAKDTGALELELQVAVIYLGENWELNMVL